MVVGQHRHDTHITNPQVLDPKHTEVTIHRSVLVTDLAHLRRPRHMPAGTEVVFPELEDILVRLRGRGNHRSKRVFAEGWVFGDVQGVPVDLDTGTAVVGVREELGVKEQRDVRVGRLQSDLAAGLLVHQEDKHAHVAVVLESFRGNQVKGEMGHEFVVWNGRPVQVRLLRCRKSLEFGRRCDAVRLEPSSSDLAGVFGPWAAPISLPLLHGRLHGGWLLEESIAVVGLGFALEAQGSEEVVAQALSDGGEVLHDRYLELLEFLRGSDARMHEDLGRIQ